MTTRSSLELRFVMIAIVVALDREDPLSVEPLDHSCWLLRARRKVSCLLHPMDSTDLRTCLELRSRFANNPWYIARVHTYLDPGIHRDSYRADHKGLVAAQIEHG